jgi:hypothetical protein
LPGRLLKTPTSQLGVNGGSQHPDKRKQGGHGPTLADEVEHLLPTPTATPYGNNQSPSPGAAVRPSLQSLAPLLLPTPIAGDAKGTRNATAGRTTVNPNINLGWTLSDVVFAGKLLPTPAAGGGTGYMSGTHSDTWRPGLERVVQGYVPILHQGRPTGGPTAPPSPDGSTSSDALPPAQPTIWDD